MVDIYLEGAEVHAEAPEEEREAALILNAVLSGKTTPADGCICPDKRDSTIGKGITMRFCDGTGMTITPTLDVEGNPELEICCGIGDFDQEELDETVYYEVTLQSKPVLRSYIAAAYRLCNELTDSELVQMGHDRDRGRIRLLQALETVDALADYDEEAATEEFGNYMDANFPTVTFKPEFVENSDSLMSVWNKWQIKYDRLFNREFDNSKIESVNGCYKYKTTFEGLGECLEEFISNPVWLDINVNYEAWCDRQCGEWTPLQDIPGKRAKLSYLKHRILG